MSPIIRIIWTIILSGVTLVSVSAATCDIRADLPESATLISQAERCIEARRTGNPNSITDFVCPQGEFFASSGQPITRETLSYLIAVQLSMSKVDTDIIQYMKQLQNTRESDPTRWIETIRSCTDQIRVIYSQICGFGTLEARLNTDKNKLYITSTNTYPQTLCTDIATKKII
jgi:hypothetical protein